MPHKARTKPKRTRDIANHLFLVLTTVTCCLMPSVVKYSYNYGRIEIQERIMAVCDGSDTWGNPITKMVDQLVVLGDGCRIMEYAGANKYKSDVTKWKE